DKSVSLPRSCRAGMKPALGGYGGDVGVRYLLLGLRGRCYSLLRAMCCVYE
ncbi:hypothetical protein A2U01_0071127, partial [Trifolium medium]|nr:hypothetical protein [Trifolium medium]